MDDSSGVPFSSYHRPLPGAIGRRPRWASGCLEGVPVRLGSASKISASICAGSSHGLACLRRCLVRAARPAEPGGRPPFLRQWWRSCVDLYGVLGLGSRVTDAPLAGDWGLPYRAQECGTDWAFVIAPLGCWGIGRG